MNKRNYKASMILIILILLSSIVSALPTNNNCFDQDSVNSFNGSSRSKNYDNWSEEINLSINGGEYIIEPIFEVYKNNVHVLWEEYKNIYYRRSDDYGNNWSQIIKIAGEPNYNATEPTIAIDQEKIYVAWVNSTFIWDGDDGYLTDYNGEIFYKYSLNNGLSWSNDIEIISNHSFFPSLAIGNNKIHLVWSENSYWCTPDIYVWYDFEIFYLNFTINNIGNPILLAKSTTSLTDQDYSNPDIAVEDNYIHVTWVDYYINYNYFKIVRYINSYDGGINWNEIKNVTNLNDVNKLQALKNYKNNVYIISLERIEYDNWYGSFLLKFYNSSDNGNTWSNKTIVNENYCAESNLHEGPHFDIENGNIYVVWHHNYEIYLRVSYDCGESWDKIVRVTDTLNNSMFPRIEVDEKYIHLIWLNKSYPQDLYYKHHYPVKFLKIVPIIDHSIAFEEKFFKQKFSSVGASEELVNWTYETNATWLNWGPENHTLHGVPTNDDVGQYWVRLNISYQNDLFDEHNFTLTVQNVNDPPEIIGAPSKFYFNAYQDYLFDFTPYLLDIDNDTEDLRLIEDSDYATTIDLVITFNYPNTVSSEIINITATDGIDYSNVHSIEVVINPIEFPLPVILDKSPVGEDIPIWSNITVIFNQLMNKTSVETAFAINLNVLGEFVWNKNFTKMTFYPNNNLSHNQRYIVNISSTAKNMFGDTLDGNMNNISEGSPIDDYSWDFTCIENITQNTKPSIQIDFPITNSVFNLNATIYFDCFNTTDPDGDILEFLWISNISGILSTNPQFSTNLPMGHHQITLFVNDGYGHNVSEAINIIITPWNRPPVAIISSPSEGAVFNITDSIQFDASSSYDLDLDTLDFYWHSNISGGFGYSSRFNTQLPEGRHLITLHINDGFYHNVSISINLTVIDPSSGSPGPGNNDGTKPPPTTRDDSFYSTYGLYIGIVLVVIIITIFGFATATEVGKYGVLGAMVPLYRRLKGKKVLDNETRGMVRGYILANPGEHYSIIKRTLKLPNGTLTYHLKVLEDEGLVKSERDGIYKRFYPIEMQLPKNATHLSRIQETILNEIIVKPGITESDLGKNIEVSPRVINYHVKALVSAGLIKAERFGKKNRYYVIEGIE
jgi:DNA-binding transcriptional ArsR family regulator